MAGLKRKLKVLDIFSNRLQFIRSSNQNTDKDRLRRTLNVADETKKRVCSDVNINAHFAGKNNSKKRGKFFVSLSHTLSAFIYIAINSSMFII